MTAWRPPAAPSILDGTVSHHRHTPAEHRFDLPVSYVWFDPEHPEALTDEHRRWSSQRPAPVYFRRADYGDPDRADLDLAEQTRRDLVGAAGRAPAGPVWMLTQLRRWGWLFNPITVYVVWDDPFADPVGAVLEVTNTPWKQRHRYPVLLTRDGDQLVTVVDKELHVSPFLDADYHYDVRLSTDPDRFDLQIDVRRGDNEPVLHTRLHGPLLAATRAELSRSLRCSPLATMSVSAGIHWQALRLWLKRVPFVANPSRHQPRSVATPPADRRRPGTIRSRAARRVTHALLSRFDRERLVVHDSGGRREFGADGHVDIAADLRVLDQRAYSAIVTEGAAGLGRAYFEHWWTSDDPVAVLRVLIRNMEPWDRRRNRLTAITRPVTDRIRRRLPADTRERNRDDISAHYDLGNDLFTLFLDDTLTYSSAIFDDGAGVSLEEASVRKYDRLLEAMGVTESDHLLEIGTGWGGMALHAATTIGCRVTSTTISREQLKLAEQRVAESGVGDRIELLDRDWRDLTGTYDHLVSIEMIEAVSWRDYDAFFGRIDQLVKPGGRVALQAIAIPDDRWERAKNTVDFIRRYVFPNGYLPSMGAIRSSLERATTLRLDEVNDHTPSYAETLRHWRTRFDDNIDRVRELGYDDRFIRLWRFYLMYCEAGFEEGHVRLHQIVLTKPQPTDTELLAE